MPTKFFVTFAAFLLIIFVIIDAAPASLAADNEARNGPHVIPPVIAGEAPPPSPENLTGKSQSEVEAKNGPHVIPPIEENPPPAPENLNTIESEKEAKNGPHVIPPVVEGEALPPAPETIIAESKSEARNGPHVIPPVIAGEAPPPSPANLSAAAAVAGAQPKKVLRRRPLQKLDKKTISLSSLNNVQTMQQRDAGKKVAADQSADYYYYYYYY
uniref:Uncharacterized protein n=1 Tax=Panagrolaimus sp. PS1159 TaxID=55785 RepID=A0AC35FIL2_9BILA